MWAIRAILWPGNVKRFPATKFYGLDRTVTGLKTKQFIIAINFKIRLFFTEKTQSKKQSDAIERLVIRSKRGGPIIKIEVYRWLVI